MKNLESLLKEINRLKDIGVETPESIRKMVLDMISEAEAGKMNKSNNTAQLQKKILTYLKKIDNNRPVLKTVLKNDNGYWFANGFTGFHLNTDLQIEGLPLYDKETVKSDFPDLTKIFVCESDMELSAEIDLKILAEKIAIMKSKKAKVASSKDDCVQIGDKYFNPLLIKEIIDILGEITDVKFTEGKTKPIQMYSKIGKAIVLPLMIRD